MIQQLMICFDILRYQKHPQDLPYQPMVVCYLAILMSVLLAGLDSALGATGDNLLAIIGIVIASTLGFTAIVLLLAQKFSRFIQAVTALLGVESLLNLFTLLYVMVLLPLNLNVLTLLVTMTLTIWRLSTFCRIFREMLEAQTVTAVMLTISFEFLRVGLLFVFAPPGVI